MALLLLAALVSLISVGAADPVGDSEACAADARGAPSPALVQVQSSHTKRSSSSELGGESADLELHGVRVINYYHAFRAGKEAHEEQDYNIRGNDPVTWIVTFKEGTTEDKIHEFCASIRQQDAECVQEGHPDHGGGEEAIVNGTQASLDAILAAHNEIVKGVEADAIEKLDLWSEDEDDQERRSVPWGLDRSDQAQSELSGTYTSPGNRGRGVHVYVFDTGIRTTHDEFGGRAIPTYSVFSGNGDVQPHACDPADTACAADGNGHGTHCAGTVAGATFGIAPEAIVHAVKVMSDRGHGPRSLTMMTLDWVGTNKAGDRAVVSMSMGGHGRSMAYQEIIGGLLNNGIVTVVAAGNDNHDACRNSPGFVPHAITVGSITRGDAISPFSNYGACVDIFAPGSRIESCSSGTDTSWSTKSGTSMSCPHVSGAAAVAFSNIWDMSAEGIVELLRESAVKDQLGSTGQWPEGTPNLLLQVPTEERPIA